MGGKQCGSEDEHSNAVWSPSTTQDNVRVRRGMQRHLRANRHGEAVALIGRGAYLNRYPTLGATDPLDETRTKRKRTHPVAFDIEGTDARLSGDKRLGIPATNADRSSFHRRDVQEDRSRDDEAPHGPPFPLCSVSCKSPPTALRLAR